MNNEFYGRLKHFIHLPHETRTQLIRLVLTGSLQTELSRVLECVNLVMLDIGHMGVQSLDWSIGKLSNLERLYVYANKLCVLPSSIGQCTKLSLIDVEENHLTRLPPTLAALPSLGTVLLLGNRLPVDFNYQSSDIAARIGYFFAHRGSRNAALCIMRRLSVYRDVLRYILVPMLLHPRGREEWPDADDVARNF